MQQLAINDPLVNPSSGINQLLLDGLNQLNLTQSLDEYQQMKLIKYVELLNKWNKTYNLTSVRKPEQMVSRHLLDSLAICPYIRGKRILDVGTGAGLPGIPLAVSFPSLHFTLLDSNNKKTRFVTQAISELELSNVDVVQSRVEDAQFAEPFDVIITRAYSAIGDMLKQTAHLLAEDGCFLAMKGINPVAEIDELPENFLLKENYVINVPGLDESRHLLEIISK